MCELTVISPTCLIYIPVRLQTRGQKDTYSSLLAAPGTGSSTATTERREYHYLSELAAHAQRSHLVITTGTFSKTVAPGLRVGWVLGSPALVAACDLLKFDNGM